MTLLSRLHSWKLEETLEWRSEEEPPSQFHFKFFQDRSSNFSTLTFLLLFYSQQFQFGKLVCQASFRRFWAFFRASIEPRSPEKRSSFNSRLQLAEVSWFQKHLSSANVYKWTLFTWLDSRRLLSSTRNLLSLENFNAFSICSHDENNEINFALIPITDNLLNQRQKSKKTLLFFFHLHSPSF